MVSEAGDDLCAEYCWSCVFTTIIWVHFESYIMLFCSVVWKSRCAVETRQSHIWASFIGIKAVAGRRNSRLCYSSVWLCSLRHLVYALCNGPWTEGVCVCVHVFVCMWLGSFCRNCANKLLTWYLAELLSQIMYLVIITVTFIEKKWWVFFITVDPVLGLLAYCPSYSTLRCGCITWHTSGDRPFCGAMVEWCDGPSWLRDDDYENLSKDSRAYQQSVLFNNYQSNAPWNTITLWIFTQNSKIEYCHWMCIV